MRARMPGTVGAVGERVGARSDNGGFGPSVAIGRSPLKSDGIEAVGGVGWLVTKLTLVDAFMQVLRFALEVIDRSCRPRPTNFIDAHIAPIASIRHFRLQGSGDLDTGFAAITAGICLFLQA